MAGWFQCSNCDARYQFDAAVTGRALACRFCGCVFRVPPVPVSTVPHPESVSASGGRWVLRFPSGRQFGPVLTQMIEEWVSEGRADGESLVCPEGGADWYRLADAFPDMVGAPDPEAETAGTDPAGSPAEHIPAAGLLELLPDQLAEMPQDFRTLQAAALENLEKEVRRTMGTVKLNGTRARFAGEAKFLGGETHREAAQLRAEHMLIAELSAHGMVYYLVIPWCSMGQLAHEFFSILPGRLPHPLALRRACEDSFSGGQWIGINGMEDDVLAIAARHNHDSLVTGIVWNWYSARRDYTMVQVWGVQAVPLGTEKFIHAVQTNPRGPGGNDLGLLWYLERQSAFYRFARRLNIPDTHEAHILFGSCTGQVLVDAADALAAPAV
jgi:hypothetical protein